LAKNQLITFKSEPKGSSLLVTAFTSELNVTRYTTENGCLTDRRNYQCVDCQECPLKPHCTKAKGNRSIRISFRL